MDMIKLNGCFTLLTGQRNISPAALVCVCGGARRLRNLLPQLFTVWLKSDLTLMVA
jgi:hypothetical protein